VKSEDKPSVRYNCRESSSIKRLMSRQLSDGEMLAELRNAVAAERQATAPHSA
jgi:hypothetical protein